MSSHEPPEVPLSLPPEEPDPGHLLPPEEWQQVVEEAEREARRIAEGRPPAQPPRGAARRYGTGLVIPVSGAVSAPRNGGRRPGALTFGVLHDAETPLRAGFAASIARYFATAAPTSCHYMVDPAETWGVLDDGLIAWHCGNGNPHSLAVEQAGYASFTRAQWLSAEGRAQLGRVAAIVRAARDRYGIAPRWMSDDELLAAHRGRLGGWATHDQCRRVLGGTTHHDPEPNYPKAELMELANDEGDDMPTAREVAAEVWSYELSGLAVPTAAGRVLVDARGIARRGEMAVLALQRALAAHGAAVTAGQLTAALAEVEAELGDEPVTR